MLNRPVTELSNDFTNNIDLATSLEALRLLRQSDAQIFAGWKHHVALADTEILNKIERVSDVVAQVIAEKEDGTIIFSGCGTSGRIAYLVARNLNAILKKNGKHACCQYLISGGDKALMMSDELPEDDPVLGALNLCEAVDGKKRVLFVGISCGLSAPYVAGQLDAALTMEGVHTVMMGFNPVEYSRDVAVENWTHTFRQIAMKVAAADGNKATVLNPIVGPESITGSSRMKGGSVTQILLESCVSLGLQKAGLNTLCANNARDIVTAFQQVADQIYHDSTMVVIAGVVDVAAECLKAGGHLYYLCDAIAGPLALIDASEMPDTYGAPFDEVRGFVDGGWNVMDNVGGDLGAQYAGIHRIAVELFEVDVLPQVDKNDCIAIVVGFDGLSSSLVRIADLCKAQGSKLILIHVGDQQTMRHLDFESRLCDAAAFIPLSHVSIVPGSPALAQFALKLILNDLSTISQVRKGKVFSNRMINLGVSNNKLFFRSITIISEIMHVSDDVARTALIKAIHEVDEISEDLRNQTVRHHIEVATPKPNSLPLAFLLSSGVFKSVQQAKDMLMSHPIVRNAIFAAQQQQQQQQKNDQ